MQAVTINFVKFAIGPIDISIKMERNVNFQDSWSNGIEEQKGRNVQVNLSEMH